MMEPFIQVSDAVQDRYDRAQFEYQRARKEWLEAWEAMQRERYAIGEMQTAHALAQEQEQD